MGTFSSWSIRETVELQDRISAFQCSICKGAVGYNIEQISSDKRETLENDSFHWKWDRPLTISACIVPL